MMRGVLGGEKGTLGERELWEACGVPWPCGTDSKWLGTRDNQFTNKAGLKDPRDAKTIEEASTSS